jgi:ADP-ribose pyrophosphatase YjhB (NUDIX family)
MPERVYLVSAACVYKRGLSLRNKKDRGSILWFLVKEKDDGGWGVPKTVTRTGESSVRASIRTMSEQGGMRAKVLEEVGRHGGAAKVADKIVTQRTIYYLIAHKGGEETLEYVATEWVEHSLALRRVEAKLDREMLKSARVLLNEIRAKRRKQKAEQKKLEKEAAMQAS